MGKAEIPKLKVACEGEFEDHLRRRNIGREQEEQERGVGGGGGGGGGGGAGALRFHRKLKLASLSLSGHLPHCLHLEPIQSSSQLQEKTAEFGVTKNSQQGFFYFFLVCTAVHWHSFKKFLQEQTCSLVGTNSPRKGREDDGKPR